MSFFDTGLFGLMRAKMSYLAERQGVLADNIAHVDVPGSQPHDLKKMDFSSFLPNASAGTMLAVTQPGHLTASGASAGVKGESEVQRSTFETTPTGSSIVIEEQMAKVSENAMDYQMTTGVYKKMMELFKLAAGSHA